MWFGMLLMLVGGFWLGRKYQDFSDLMLARRVAKIIEQRNQLVKDRDEWEKVTAQ